MPMLNRARAVAILALCALCAAAAVFAAPPAFVDITWMSISNMYFEIGPLNIIADGYFTRIPESAFFGGGGGLASTKTPYPPDVAAVTRVMNALGGSSKVNLL